MPEPNPPGRLRVLCIDHEGGHGGSSRSLFEFIKNVDCEQVWIEVRCRRPSYLTEQYASLGVRCIVDETIPLWRAQKTFHATVLDLLRLVPETLQIRRRAAAYAREIDERFDVVHFNYESLLPLLFLLRSRTQAAFVMHMRNWTYDRPWVRMQYRLMARWVDHFVFIFGQ